MWATVLHEAVLHRLDCRCGCTDTNWPQALSTWREYKIRHRHMLPVRSAQFLCVRQPHCVSLRSTLSPQATARVLSAESSNTGRLGHSINVFGVFALNSNTPANQIRRSRVIPIVRFLSHQAPGVTLVRGVSIGLPEAFGCSPPSWISLR